MADSNNEQLCSLITDFLANQLTSLTAESSSEPQAGASVDDSSTADASVLLSEIVRCLYTQLSRVKVFKVSKRIIALSTGRALGGRFRPWITICSRRLFGLATLPSHIICKRMPRAQKSKLLPRPALPRRNALGVEVTLLCFDLNPI